jgi:repressor LexA
MALTRRQREIYDFIRSFVARHGYSPSLEEIGAHFGLSSVATVHKHVEHLVAKGWLRKAANRSRSVEPASGRPEGMLSLPLLGTVAAGEPIEAIGCARPWTCPASSCPAGGTPTCCACAATR